MAKLSLRMSRKRLVWMLLAVSGLSLVAFTTTLLISSGVDGELLGLKSALQRVRAATSAGAEVYLTMLEVEPLQTKIMTSIILYCLSDIIAQLIEGTKVLKLERTLRFCVFGGLVWTPFLHYWYNFLEHMVQPTNILHTALMVLCDQGIGTPIYMVTFFSAMSIMKREPWMAAQKKIREEGRKIVLITWAFWVPVQLCNFTFVPLHLRILAVNSLSLIWNIIFSMLTMGRSSEKDKGYSNPAESKKDEEVAV
mmetsp:Transcript_2098/g.6273  ORF Transcript_2098/g.6273 Transcript_2098/m.6273 type:complete len:252 (-) Transcript_2098:138-893(-)